APYTQTVLARITRPPWGCLAAPSTRAGPSPLSPPPPTRAAAPPLALDAPARGNTPPPPAPAPAPPASAHKTPGRRGAPRLRPRGRRALPAPACPRQYQPVYDVGADEAATSSHRYLHGRPFSIAYRPVTWALDPCAARPRPPGSRCWPGSYPPASVSCTAAMAVSTSSTSASVMSECTGRHTCRRATSSATGSGGPAD